jgi:GDPmannose 4,6-dehydratase
MPRRKAAGSGRKVLITGITGQDGSYLAERLLAEGCSVWGLVRRSSSFNTKRIDHLYQDPHDRAVRLRLEYGDLGDTSSMVRLLARVRPDEVYNLGAQSHVRTSFDIPEETSEATAAGALRLLAGIRDLGIPCRFYQASSSEIFGGSLPVPQTESNPLTPRSPYAIAKAYAFHMTRIFREAWGLFAVNGILFNHESPRRGETFVTRKITRAAARIALGLQDTLYLGNLDAERDWGYAPEYVDAMVRMLRAPAPDDYVIATGESHSVREFCERAFRKAGVPIRWAGQGESEKGLDRRGRVRVAIDPRYYRPAEVDSLRGDASKAERALGWKPKVRFARLVEIMLRHDMALARAEKRGRGVGPDVVVSK